MSRRHLVLLCWLAPLCAQAQPHHVYLTWQGSPSSTVTVNAHTAAPDDDLTVYYDTVARGGEVDAYRYRARGTAHQIEGLPDGRWIHRIELTDLEPDTPYAFVVGSGTQGFSEERAFHTLPDDNRPVRFVTGGDLGVGAVVDSLLQRAAARSPRFALIGGDIAYVNGNLAQAATWDQWLDAWETHMITPEGFTVPMVLAVGNHEVQGGYLGGPERAPFYMGFFAQPGRPSYFRLRFGTNFVVYALDSGHIVSHEAQTDWLAEHLEADREIPYRFAAYHIPLYPSHRSYDGLSSDYGRIHWAPLFDRYGLTAAFENHDHTFKRTRLLREGEVVVDGTLYLGDGSWGRGDRTISLTNPWYLAKAGSNRHFWVVDVSTEGVVYRAFDTHGKTFDVYPTETPGYAQAHAYFQTLPQLYELDNAALAVDALDPLTDAFREATVRATLRNTETYRALVSACLETVAPLYVAAPCTTVNLAPGDSSALTFDLRSTRPVHEDLFPHAAIRAAFTFVRAAEDTVTVEAVQRVAAERTFAALPREAAVTLDGDLDDWDALPYPFAAAAPHILGTGRWQGAEDASLRFAAAYDDTQLYLALHVTDDRVLFSPEHPLWDPVRERPLQDALLMWLDPHPGGEGDDDPYLIAAPDATDGEAVLIAADADHAALAESARAAAKRTPDGYVLELAVPLALLGNDAPLQAVRLNFALSDLDAPGENPDIIFWRPQWESAYDHDGFGVVALQPR